MSARDRLSAWAKDPFRVGVAALAVGAVAAGRVQPRLDGLPPLSLVPQPEAETASLVRVDLAGLRAAALTLLVPAAWLTDTLRMFTRIGEAVADWALGLVFSPVVWMGVTLAGVSVVLLVVSGMVARRGVGTGGRGARGRRGGAARADEPPAVGPAGKGAPAIDDDLADILEHGADRE